VALTNRQALSSIRVHKHKTFKTNEESNFCALIQRKNLDHHLQKMPSHGVQLSHSHVGSNLALAKSTKRELTKERTSNDTLQKMKC
jgi:hypothetical protein